MGGIGEEKRCRRREEQKSDAEDSPAERSGKVWNHFPGLDEHAERKQILEKHSYFHTLFFLLPSFFAALLWFYLPSVCSSFPCVLVILTFYLFFLLYLEQNRILTQFLISFCLYHTPFSVCLLFFCLFFASQPVLYFLPSFFFPFCLPSFLSFYLGILFCLFCSYSPSLYTFIFPSVSSFSLSFLPKFFQLPYLKPKHFKYNKFTINVYILHKMEPKQQNVSMKIVQKIFRVYYLS